MEVFSFFSERGGERNLDSFYFIFILPSSRNGTLSVLVATFIFHLEESAIGDWSAEDSSGEK